MEIGRESNLKLREKYSERDKTTPEKGNQRLYNSELLCLYFYHKK